MTRAPLPFYRSELSRWAFILTGSYLAYALSPWGPDQWRNTPSLRWLHTVIPFPVMAGGFVLYVLMHLLGSLAVTVFADYFGLVLYGLGLFALLVTIRLDRPTNPIGVAALILACVFHHLAGKLALAQKAGA